MIIWKYIAFGNASVTLSVAPKTYVVLRKFIHVIEAFNAGSSNNISFGFTGTEQAFGTNTAAGSTGWKAVSDGASTGFNSTSRVIKAFYVQTGGAATTGKALVGIEIEPTP